MLAPRGHIDVFSVYMCPYVHTYGTCMRLRFIAQFATHQEIWPKFYSRYLSYVISTKYGENDISAMPRSVLRFSIWSLTIQTFTHTCIYVADVLPHFWRLVLIGREQPHYYCRRLSAPGAIYTSPATCFSTRPVGQYCRKNRELLLHTHCTMECSA